MKYKVMVKSYSQKFSEQIAGKDYNEAVALTKMLNNESKDKWRVKQMIATPFGVEVVYTVIFEKE
jgi:hypothetical protein